MSELSKVMREWHRMCHYFFHGAEIELNDKTEEEFNKYLETQQGKTDKFLVYLRQRYSWSNENEWEYLILYGSFDYEHYDIIPTFVWEWDWNEGQDIVEYLGVCPII